MKTWLDLSVNRVYPKLRRLIFFTQRASTSKCFRSENLGVPKARWNRKADLLQLEDGQEFSR